MNRLGWVVVMAALVNAPVIAEDAAAPESAPAASIATKGKMLYSTNGMRVGAVYRVTADGAAQVIIDGKMVTIPATTLSIKDGKLTTSLSKQEVVALR